MKFCSLASGSSGNCQYIETQEKRILIDAGMSGVKIQGLLEQIQVDPTSLDAIFVTHEHLDHASGVGVLARRYGLEVFANESTWKAMESTVKKIPSAQCHVFENEESFRYGDIHVQPMKTFHDCVEGSAFVLESRGKKVSLLTDTGWVNTQMKGYMDNSQLYYIESNHDEEMVINGPYSFPLKQRILSNRGHLSNGNAGSILAELLRKQSEKVILAHLSQDNNVPILAARTVRDVLNHHGIFEGTDFIMEVAKRMEPSAVHEL